MLDIAIHGKSDPTRKTKDMHPAIFHMLDVGHVILELWERYSNQEKDFIAQSLELPLKEVPIFLSTFASLHDIGKITPSFASQLKNSEYLDNLEFRGYDVFKGDKIVENYHTNMGFSILERYFGKNLRVATTYLSGHHGTFFKKKNLILKGHIDINKLNRDVGGEKWQEQQDVAIKFLVEYFEGGEILSKAKFTEQIYGFFVMGLLSISDWLASNVFNFPLTLINGIQSYTLKSYIEESKKRAKIAVDNNFPKITNFNLKEFGELFQNEQGQPLEPYETQKALIEAVEDISEPSLVAIEDTTGNGKTEMMLYAAHKICNSVGHRGIKYLLPTQATSNAMWERFLSFAANTLPEEEVIDIQLVHSGTTFNNVNIDKQSKISITNFFRRRHCKLMSFFTIGTIDQGLLGFISIKYFYFRLIGLFNSVLIIDEIHSYDAYTSKIIQSLIKFAKILRCSVIFSTATLSSKQCSLLIKEYCPNNKLIIPYPGIGIFNSSSSVRSIKSIKPRKIKIEIKETNNRTQIVSDIWNKLGNADKGCLFCNTVPHTQEMYRIAKAKGYNVVLVHSKFVLGRKNELTQQINDWCGKNPSNEKLLVIATQVLEQSFNISFDYMASYLCPIDFLIQRLGRLWRFYKERLQNHPIIKIYKEKNNHQDWVDELIYHPSILSKTWELLQKTKEICVPSDVQRLINLVYDTPDLSYKSGQAHLVNKINPYLIEVAYEDGFLTTKEKSENELQISTRNIEETTMVVPCKSIKGNKITLLNGTEIEQIDKDDVEMIFNHHLAVAYNQVGVRTTIENWKEDATLRYVVPVVVPHSFQNKKGQWKTSDYNDEIGWHNVR